MDKYNSASVCNTNVNAFVNAARRPFFGNATNPPTTSCDNILLPYSSALKMHLKNAREIFSWLLSPIIITMNCLLKKVTVQRIWHQLHQFQHGGFGVRKKRIVMTYFFIGKDTVKSVPFLTALDED